MDREFSALAQEALDRLPPSTRRPFVVDLDDPEYKGNGFRFGFIEYEDFLASGDPTFEPLKPSNEWDAIALNYTSGTTGVPKGVVTHHRGAYLVSAGNALTWDMPLFSKYLWTLPMFHCNGWNFLWTVCLRASEHICLRSVETECV